MYGWVNGELYSFASLCFVQFLPGEEHVILLPEDTEAEMWQLCVRTAVANVKHSVRKYSKRNFSVLVVENGF